MASVVLLYALQKRFLIGAAGLCVRAPRAEPTAGRRIAGIGNFADRNVAELISSAEPYPRNRVQEHLGIWMACALHHGRH
jgi:hypothetical protein